MTDQKRILIATIATAHGIKGLVKLNINAENPQLLNDNSLYTTATGGAVLRLRLKNQMGKQWLAEIEGVTDRNRAEELRGTDLWIDRTALPPLESDDEMYIEDLIGLTVRDPDGTAIGTIIGVDNFGASDLLDIQPPTGSSFYLPFTHDTIQEIDPDNGVLVAVIPEGLL